MATVELVPPRPLTMRQRRVYDFIFASTMERGYQPSLQDVMAAFDLCSRTAVRQYLRIIAKKGWISVTGRTNRSIRFLYRPDGRPFRGFEAR